MAEPSQRPATKGCNYSFFSSWWWVVCRPKHVEQLRNTGIINSTTWLHLVGSFYEFYITMHGSMNTKYYNYIWQYRHLVGCVSTNKCASIVGCSCYHFELNPTIYSQWVMFGLCQFCIQWEIRYDMTYVMIYDIIYLLTAIGLSPGGSTHLHTNNT